MKLADKLKQTSVVTKYRFSRVVFAAAFVLEVICIIGIYSSGGLAGTNVFRLKLWFILLLAVLLFGLPGAVAYYYYRGRLRNVETGIAEAEALAHAGGIMLKEDKSKHRPPTGKMLQ